MRTPALDLINYFRFCCCACCVQVLLQRRRIVANKSFSPASSLNVRSHPKYSTILCLRYFFHLFFLWFFHDKMQRKTSQVMYEMKEMKLIRIPSYRQCRRGHTHEMRHKDFEKYSSREIYRHFSLHLHSVLFAQRTRDGVCDWIV